MSLRSRAVTVVVLGLVFVAVVGFILFRQSTVVNRSVDAVLGSYDPAASEAAILETAISDMQRGVTGYLLTGQEADLRPYVDGARRSALALQRSGQLLAEDEQLTQVVGWVTDDRQRWIDEVARPTIDATRAGQFDAALSFYSDPRAAEYLDSLLADSATLRALIEDRREEAFTYLTDLSYRLIQVVVIAMGVLILLILLAAVLANRWVLRPLEDLRAQLQLVAREGEHKRTIVPSGPPELHKVGEDAEEMRRQLVSEIHEVGSARKDAQSAWEALVENAPQIVAIREELAAAHVPEVPGLSVSGRIEAAEGILAGDWWDAGVLPSGEAIYVVVDISGHGAEAGAAAIDLKRSLLRGLADGKDYQQMAQDSSDVFETRPDRFATLVAVGINPETGVLRWINAGHHAPLVIDREGQVVRSLEPTGPILSYLGGQWRVESTELPPGYTVLMFSDGLVESHDAQGEELSAEELAEWIAAVPTEDWGPDDLVRWLLGEGRDRAVDWDRDDVTVVAVQRAAPPEPEHEESPKVGRRLRRAAEKRAAAKQSDTHSGDESPHS